MAELPELPAQDHEKGQKRLLGRFWQCKTRIGVFIFVIQFTENKELTAICVCSKLTSLRPHCQNPFSSFVENSFFKTPNGKTHCQNPPHSIWVHFVRLNLKLESPQVPPICKLDESPWRGSSRGDNSDAARAHLSYTFEPELSHISP